MSTLRPERIDHADARPHRRAARVWRNAMFVVFAACGFALAAWVSRTPAVRDGLGASTGHMGWLIFAIAGGAIFGLVSAGALIGRFGARPVIRTALITAALGLLVVAIGAGLASSGVVFAGLLVFGLGFGTCDVSMNVAGAANERMLGRTVMPIFHAMYSIGTLTGAALGVLATVLGVPVAVHLSVAAVIVVLAVIPAVRLVPAGVGRASRAQPKLTTAERVAVWKDPRTLLIGLMVLGMGFAEGAAEDWLPLATVDGYGVSETVGAAHVRHLRGDHDRRAAVRCAADRPLRSGRHAARLGAGRRPGTDHHDLRTQCGDGRRRHRPVGSRHLARAAGRHVRSGRRPADRFRPRQCGGHGRLRRVPVRTAGAGHARRAHRSAALVRGGAGAGRRRRADRAGGSAAGRDVGRRRPSPYGCRSRTDVAVPRPDRLSEAAATLASRTPRRKVRP